MDVSFIDGVTWEPQRRHNSLLDQVVKYLWASNCFTGSSLGGFDLSWGMVFYRAILNRSKLHRIDSSMANAMVEFGGLLSRTYST